MNKVRAKTLETKNDRGFGHHVMSIVVHNLVWFSLVFKMWALCPHFFLNEIEYHFNLHYS